MSRSLANAGGPFSRLVERAWSNVPGRTCLVQAACLIAAAACPQPAVGQDPGQFPDQFRWEVKEGKLVQVPIVQNPALPSNPVPPQQPVQPVGGRGQLVKNLIEGDPFAWAILGGTVLTILLGLGIRQIVHERSQMKGTPAPAGIAAAWQKQRGRCLVAAVLIVPGIFLGIGAGIVLQEPVVAGVALFAVLFVALVISIVNWRCPACGSNMGHNWNPAFCPHCGTQLR